MRWSYHVDNVALATEREQRNRLVGVVRDIAYFGDSFMYLVEVPGHGTVRASEAATRRLPDAPITWNDRVVLEWQSFACRLLAE